ncbi:MAG: glycosyltransferase family 39 protein [Chloroflexi bacterium]|nr:glycosyltransferase family 39 protein [Chloroflexota bacterium]
MFTQTGQARIIAGMQSQNHLNHHAPNRNTALWIPTLLLLGVFLWLGINLPHESLWYDETVNAYLAKSSWSTIWDWSRTIDNQMPLHFWLLKLWVGLVGQSEFALRLFSAFSAWLAAAGIYALGKRLTGKMMGGVFALILLAGSGSFLYAAGEVRTYALALALLTWSCVLLWELWRDAGRIHWKLLAAYLVVILLMVYSHYTAWLGVAAQGIFVGVRLLQNRGRGFKQAILIPIGLALGFTPWLMALAGRDFNAGTAFYGEVSWRTAFEAYIGFAAFGQKILDDAARQMTWWLVAGTVLGGMIWAVAQVWKEGGSQIAAIKGWRDGLVLAVVLLIVPLAGLIFSVNQIEGKLSGRHAWVMWPAIALLLGGGLGQIYAWLPIRVLRISLLGVVIIGLGGLAKTDAGLQDEYSGDFRQAFAILQREANPDDILILQDGTLFTAAEYYESPIPYIGIPQDKITDVNHEVQFYEAMDSLALILRPQTQHIWVMAWQGNTMDPTMLAFALPEYLSDGQRRVWMGPTGPDVYGEVALVEYQITEVKESLLDHIVGYPGILKVQPDGPALLGFDVYTSFHERTEADFCSVMVHSWWWRGDTDYPATMMSVTVFDDEEKRIIQRDQPLAGYTFGQEKWTPYVPTLGRVELQYPCDQLVSGEKYEVWLAVYDLNGEKATQTYLLATFNSPR